MSSLRDTCFIPYQKKATDKIAQRSGDIAAACDNGVPEPTKVVQSS